MTKHLIPLMQWKTVMDFIFFAKQKVVIWKLQMSRLKQTLIFGLFHVVEVEG